jgi:PPOX class probable F420-dependent enzyme
MLELVRRLAAAAHGLAVVATNRSDGTIQASLVNAGLIDHPLSSKAVIAFVARPRTVKLRLLRRSPQATVTFQAGHEWVTVEGQAELVGPDDPLAGVTSVELPALMRTVYRAAGGSHNDWPTFDRVMAEERRLIVLVTCDRVYSNPGRSQTA